MTTPITPAAPAATAPAAPVVPLTPEAEYDDEFTKALAALDVEIEAGEQKPVPAPAPVTEATKRDAEVISDAALAEGAVAPAKEPAAAAPAVAPVVPVAVSAAAPAPAAATAAAPVAPVTPVSAAATPAPAVAAVTTATPAPAAAPVKEEEFKLPEFITSDEDKALLVAVTENYPDIGKAFGYYERKAQHEAQNKLVAALANVMGHFNTQVNPLLEKRYAESYNEHLTAIKAKHPDYDTVVDAVDVWINTQPAYLQPGMRKVYDGGSTQEVIELFDGFKKATVVSSPSPEPQAGTAPAAGTVPAKAAATPAEPAADPSRVAALEPVTKKVTKVAPTGSVDPNDYDAGFAEALASE